MCCAGEHEGVTLIATIPVGDAAGWSEVAEEEHHLLDGGRWPR